MCVKRDGWFHRVVRLIFFMTGTCSLFPVRHEARFAALVTLPPMFEPIGKRRHGRIVLRIIRAPLPTSFHDLHGERKSRPPAHDYLRYRQSQ
jgi:hypothetical protein